MAKDKLGHGSEKRGLGQLVSGSPAWQREMNNRFASPQATPAHAVGINNVGRTPDINHPVYQTAEKPPGYNSPVRPLNADYSTSGRMLRQRMNDMTKEQHMAAGDEHARQAFAMKSAHGGAVDAAMSRLGGRDPGTLISGIVSDKFSEPEKDNLRTLAHTGSDHTSAAFAHYAAAGKRLDTARSRYQSFKK